VSVDGVTKGDPASPPFYRALTVPQVHVSTRWVLYHRLYRLVCLHWYLFDTISIIRMTIPIENGNQVGILVTSTISIFIAALSVVLRIIAKFIGFGFDLSDYCIIAALVRLCISSVSPSRLC
jgi:hypothetical protein